MNLPKVKWRPISEITTAGQYYFFGLINPRTPHECVGTFFAIWHNDMRHHLKDRDGDDLMDIPSHFLDIEHVRRQITIEPDKL